MTFDELKTALLANEVAITLDQLRDFGRDEEDELTSIAFDYRDQSYMPTLPTWAQEQGLDRSALRAIAENYLWAAKSIDGILATRNSLRLVAS